MINLTENWGHRWHAARLIHRRDLRSMLLGYGVYLVLSLALLAGVLLLGNYLNFVDENGLLVLSGAFNLPLFAIIFLSAIFLALSSVATIARERDQGTMEALFYGPIDAIAYVLGKFLAQMATYLVMVAIYALCFIIYASFTNFTFPWSLGWVVLLSIWVTANVVTFGIFVSAWSSRVRTALLLFLSVVLVLVVIQFGQELLATIPLEGGYYNPVQLLQAALGALNEIISWLSPFSYLMQGMEAVRRQSSSTYLLVLAVSTFFSLLFFILSIVVLERKGVRR